MAMKLIHISDIHLGPLPKARLRELANKRVTGLINWKRNRGDQMGGIVLQNLLREIRQQRPDHVAITGDLINIGLDAEIEAASLWLTENFDPETTSVVPGNHDAYIRGTLAKALKTWAPFMRDDNGRLTLKNADFPYLRVRQNVALVGVSSAVATPAFVAGGRFGTAQAKRLAYLLEKAGEEGQFRVVMIHHPPVRNATLPRKRLYGIGAFQETLAKAGAELVLHGHTHLSQRHEIEGPRGSTIPVIGVPAASQDHGGKKPAAAFNMFQIEGSAGNWQCNMQENSISAAATGLFEITDERWLHG